MTTPTKLDTLYHYTSQQGLLGIIKNKELLMTDILYLSDSSEYKHTLDLLKSLVETREKQLSTLTGMSGNDVNSKVRKVYRYLKSYCELGIDKTNERLIENYIFSLSRKEDDLNQWRSYCPREGGFSIGFDYKRLSSIIYQEKNKGYTIRECIYDPTKKNEIINSILKPIDDILENEKNDFDVEGLYSEIIIQMTYHSSYLKHKKFEDEQEFRIINNGINVFDIIDYRQGKSMIVPHVRFSPRDVDDNLPISKIIIGPTPLPELSRLSVRSLLESKNYEEVKVEISNIPYRSW